MKYGVLGHASGRQCKNLQKAWWKAANRLNSCQSNETHRWTALTQNSTPSIIWNRIKAKEADTHPLFGHFKTILLVLVDKIAFVAAIKAAFFLSRVD